MDNNELTPPSCGQLLIGSAFFALVIAIVVVLAKGIPFTSDSASFWTAMSAIATAIAAFTAIGIALYGNCMEKKRSKFKSVVLRNVMFHELSNLADASFRVSTAMRSVRKVDGEWVMPSYKGLNKKSYKEFVLLSEIPTCRALVLELHELPQAELEALGTIMGIINKCRNICEALSEVDYSDEAAVTIEFYNLEESKKLIRKLCESLQCVLEPMKDLKSDATWALLAKAALPAESDS